MSFQSLLTYTVLFNPVGFSGFHYEPPFLPSHLWLHLQPHLDLIFDVWTIYSKTLWPKPPPLYLSKEYIITNTIIMILKFFEWHLISSLFLLISSTIARFTTWCPPPHCIYVTSELFHECHRNAVFYTCLLPFLYSDLWWKFSGTIEDTITNFLTILTPSSQYICECF